MYYHQPLLLTPGPTPVPDAIMREIQAPMVGHRLKILKTSHNKHFKV